MSTNVRLLGINYTLQIYLFIKISRTDRIIFNIPSWNLIKQILDLSQIKFLTHKIFLKFYKFFKLKIEF